MSKYILKTETTYTFEASDDQEALKLHESGSEIIDDGMEGESPVSLVKSGTNNNLINDNKPIEDIKSIESFYLAIIAGLVCARCEKQKIDSTGACISDQCKLGSTLKLIEREKVKYQSRLDPICECE